MRPIWHSNVPLGVKSLLFCSFLCFLTSEVIKRVFTITQYSFLNIQFPLVSPALYQVCPKQGQFGFLLEGNQSRKTNFNLQKCTSIVFVWILIWKKMLFCFFYRKKNCTLQCKITWTNYIDFVNFNCFGTNERHVNFNRVYRGF